MATSIDITDAAYEGEVAGKMYAETILTGESVSKFKKYMNIKSSDKIGIINTNADPVQEADCVWNPNGSITVGEKAVSICDLKLNMEVCIKDFYASWLETSMARGNAGDEAIPMGDYIVAQILQRTKLQLEYLTWKGDVNSTNYSLCDGMLKKLEADSSVVDVTINAVTASTVIAELTKVYNAIPEQVQLQLNGANQLAVKFFCPANVITAYKLAQATVATGNGSYFVGDRPLDFLGYELVYAPGLPANHIVAANPENLWLLTDLESDFTDILLIDQRKLAGIPTVRVVAGMKFGVDFGVGAEIVLAQV
jgi:hypothetical protein